MELQEILKFLTLIDHFNLSQLLQISLQKFPPLLNITRPLLLKEHLQLVQRPEDLHGRIWQLQPRECLPETLV